MTPNTGTSFLLLSGSVVTCSQIMLEASGSIY